MKNSLWGLGNTIRSYRTSTGSWDLMATAGWDMGWTMGEAQVSHRGLGVLGTCRACLAAGTARGWFVYFLAIGWSMGPWPGATVFPYVVFFSLHFLTVKLAVDPRSPFDRLSPGERKSCTTLAYYTDRYGIPHPREGMENEAGFFSLNNCSLLSRYKSSSGFSI